MNAGRTDLVVATFRQTVDSYRTMIDATVEQLSDEELFCRPAQGINSVGIILRHLGGNLKSRWTDFLTTDGEKPSRDRDQEFSDWKGDRQSLVAYFDDGWVSPSNALDQMEGANLEAMLTIRGEQHTLIQAMTRSITHITYHVGQISLVARLVHQGDWQWLTIAPDQSRQHNESTWGTSASRSVFDNSTG